MALHLGAGKLALERRGWGSNSGYCLKQIKPGTPAQLSSGKQGREIFPRNSQYNGH